MIAQVVLEKYLAFAAGVLDYLVPPELSATLQVGQIVEVPLQNKKYHSLVVGLKVDTEIMPAGLRPIEKLLSEEIFVTAQEIAIAQEIATYYLCSLSQVLALFLPNNLWRNRIHKPQKIVYFLSPDGEQNLKGKLRSQGQQMVFDYIKQNQPVPQKDLKNLAEFKPPVLRRLLELGIVIEKIEPLTPAEPQIKKENLRKLNFAQQNAVATILAAERPVLVHGIAGSGKTEVYLQVIAELLERGKTALLLIPEIVLTPQIVEYFQRVFGETVGVIHSKLSEGEKEKIWWEIKFQQKKIIIGSRSALFYPYQNLGIIILDEAHEWTYKNDQTPRYHALKVAEILAEKHQAKVVLGTATPSVESYYKARREKVASCKLQVASEEQASDRGGEKVSPPSRGDIGDLKPQGDENSQISFAGGPPLAPLDRGEQKKSPPVKGDLGGLGVDGRFLNPPTPLFKGGLEQDNEGGCNEYHLVEMPERIYEDEIAGVNFTRASTLPEIQIIDLKHEIQKKNFSSISDLLREKLKETLQKGEQALLFLNKRGAAASLLCRECGYVPKCKTCAVSLTYHEKDGRGRMICHYCGRMSDPVLLCPQCRSPQIKLIGTGTQKVEQELKKLFPLARIGRADRDTTSAKNAHLEIYAKLKEHEVDILVGTQIIAKSFDLPLVTLVGILQAEIGLGVPDFRSGERLFQVLTQVSGRAGRRAKKGLVLLQTYHPENVIWQAIQQHNYKLFYEQEIKIREELSLPPFSSMLKLTFVDYSLKKVLAKVSELKQILSAKAPAHQVTVLSAPALIPKLHNKYHWNIILKGNEPEKLLQNLHLPPGWRIDRDPGQIV